MKTAFVKTLALATAAVLATTQLTHAAGLFADEGMDPRLRARNLKEKAKQNNLPGNISNFASRNARADAQCGSHNFGSADAGGKIGAAPREFVLSSPNAINPGSSRDCK